MYLYLRTLGRLGGEGALDREILAHAQEQPRIGSRLRDPQLSTVVAQAPYFDFSLVRQCNPFPSATDARPRQRRLQHRLPRTQTPLYRCFELTTARDVFPTLPMSRSHFP